MNKIEEMKKRAAEALARQQAIIDTAAAETRDFNEAETKEFDELTAKIKSTRAQIDRQLAVSKATLEVSELQEPAANGDTRGTVAAVTAAGAATDANALEFRTIEGDTRKLTGTDIVGICAWAAARNKAYPSIPALKHLETHGFQRVADMSRQHQRAAAETRAFQTTSGAGGDNVVFTPLSNDFIDFLYKESAFLAGGPLPIDMSYGSITIPGGNASATGAYGAEGAAIGYSQATTRKVSMTAKHLRALTAISNFSIDVSPLAVSAIIGGDLMSSVSVSMDAAGLRGDGSGSNPFGIRSLTNAAHISAATATTVNPSVLAVEADAKAMLTKLATSLIPNRRRRWIMSNRVFLYLKFLRLAISADASVYAWPQMHGAQPKWIDDIPVIVSEQVPSNLGAGTNESELYLADFGHIMMGVARTLVLKASDEASYHNAGGTLVSAFDQDETVIRAVASHDFGMRYDKSAVVLTAVKWGA